MIIIKTSPMTISEKIFSRHTNEKVYAGDTVIAELDGMMVNDGTFNLVKAAWERIESNRIEVPEKVVFLIDHSAPAPTKSAANLHKRMRKFARRFGLNFYDIGEGICHQLMPERGHVMPGELVIGADSHTVTYGALNSFSTGVGATDMAVGLTSGKLWFKVPQSIRVNLKGELDKGVFSKDIILWLASELGAGGGTYKTLEFGGPGLRSLNVSARLTISNMAIELGGKAGIMEPDEKMKNWIKKRSGEGFSPAVPDKGANYVDTVQVKLDDLKPQVALPHHVDSGVEIGETEGTEVSQGLVGTCTNGRVEDLEIAVEIARGKKIDPSCRLIVAPASREIYKKAVRKGFLEDLIDFGASIITPGCGPCLGTHNGIPGDGENVISTANRNFKGRMGNEEANIYLGSPATVMASMIEGKISDPRNYI